MCWNGQKGGLEGVRQKGWSIVNLLIIRREGKIRNTALDILAQGDSQVICTHYTTRKFRDTEELKVHLSNIKENNDIIMSHIISGTKKFGLIINKDETIQSIDYMVYGKIPIYKGNI